MKILKILLGFIILATITTPAFAAKDIDIEQNNGVYHIVLKGEKIKKRIKFILCISSYHGT